MKRLAAAVTVAMPTRWAALETVPKYASTSVPVAVLTTVRIAVPINVPVIVHIFPMAAQITSLTFFPKAAPVAAPDVVLRVAAMASPEATSQAQRG